MSVTYQLLYTNLKTNSNNLDGNRSDLVSVAVFFVLVCKLHFGRRFLQARLQRIFVARAAKNGFSVRACPAGVELYVDQLVLYVEE